MEARIEIGQEQMKAKITTDLEEIMVMGSEANEGKTGAKWSIRQSLTKRQQ
jgi:hypothetical protein